MCTARAREGHSGAKSHPYVGRDKFFRKRKAYDNTERFCGVIVFQLQEAKKMLLKTNGFCAAGEIRTSGDGQHNIYKEIISSTTAAATTTTITANALCQTPKRRRAGGPEPRVL